MSEAPFTRRTLLRGFGTALALPLLESTLPAAARRAAAGARPTRLAYVYVPNGVHLPDWWPASEGRGWKMPWLLEPLAPFRDRVSVLGGLTSDKARANGDGPGDHARAAAAWLTGVQPLKEDGKIGLGPSADQIAAARIGDRTRFRSLQLGCEKGGNAGECDSGYSCAYSSNLSWQGPTTPTSKEVSPRRVFDRLFRGGASAEAAEAGWRRREKRKSILDFVREDAQRLRGRVSEADGRKMEEFFDSVRELERRIAFAERDVVEEVPDEARPGTTPREFAEHARLMADLLVLAFRTDVTRIATFLVANEGSNRRYRALGVHEGHHAISHHDGDEAKQRQIRRINRHHVELLAHLLQGLASTEDGDATLLDRVMLVYGSNIGDGNRHEHHDVPTLLCGGGNGRLAPGSYRRFPDETPLTNLHLALLHKMDVPVKSLGDSTGRLDV